MLTTTNYKLKKPELTDSPPDITVMNPNWDLVDEKLFEVIQAWENFKAIGGEISGDIEVYKNSSEVARIKASRNDINGIKHSVSIGVGSNGQLLLTTHTPTKEDHLVFDTTTDNVGSCFRPITDNSASLGSNTFHWKDIFAGAFSKNNNGYTKLTNGVILQWGVVNTVLSTNGETVSGNITLPVAFPTRCAISIGRPSFVDGGSFKASLYNGAISPASSNTLGYYFCRHVNGPTIAEPVIINWVAIGY